MLAAGSPITLTAGHHVAIVEPSGCPARTSRRSPEPGGMGQQTRSWPASCTCPNTLDEVIMRTFRRKASEVLTLMAREGTTQNAG
jgi:hypothetical protein